MCFLLCCCQTHDFYFVMLQSTYLQHNKTHDKQFMLGCLDSYQEAIKTRIHENVEFTASRVLLTAFYHLICTEGRIVVWWQEELRMLQLFEFHCQHQEVGCHLSLRICMQII